MARRIVSQSRIVGKLSSEELASAHDMARTLRSNVARIAGQTSRREALRSSWHGACPEPNEYFRRRFAEKGLSRGEERAIERCYSSESFKA